jgi:AcrR family transcriptional regulator
MSRQATTDAPPRSRRKKHSGGRRRLSAADRRDAILTAAMETFAERGYDGASVKRIAARARISEALIYGHFPSKQALHAAALEAQSEHLLNHVGGRIREARSEDRTKGVGIRAAVDAMLEFAEENPHAWRLLFRDPPDDRQLARVHARIQAQWTEAIAMSLAGVCDFRFAEGVDPDEGMEAIAAVFKGGLVGVSEWWAINPGVSRTVVVDLFMDTTFTGIDRISVEKKARPT